MHRRPLTGTEKGALALAALFVLVGLWLVIWPRAMVVIHAIVVGDSTPATLVESVTKARARIYGASCLLCGAGITAMALYRRG